MNEILKNHINVIVQKCSTQSFESPLERARNFVAEYCVAYPAEEAGIIEVAERRHFGSPDKKIVAYVIYCGSLKLPDSAVSVPSNNNFVKTMFAQDVPSLQLLARNQDVVFYNPMFSFTLETAHETQLFLGLHTEFLVHSVVSVNSAHGVSSRNASSSTLSWSLFSLPTPPARSITANPEELQRERDPSFYQTPASSTRSSMP